MKTRRLLKPISMLACAAMLCGWLAGCGGTKMATDAGVDQEKKPVIVLGAFGTSVPKAQKALENIDTQVRKAFPGHEVRWALTAQFIINKLKKNGQTTLFGRKVPIKNLEQVYADLRKEGKTNVIVQSLHVVPGGEFNQLINVDSTGLSVRYGMPLLNDTAKIEQFVKALAPRFGGKDEVTVLCGHGNDHHKEYNAKLVELDKILRRDCKNVFLATVEGQPGTDKAFADVKKSGLKKVKFVPIMIVAGDHVMNDVMGDENDSWKAILKLPATSEEGLGHNNAIVGLYVDRIRAAMKK